MVQTPRFHCRDHVFDPWSGNSDPACRTSWPEEKKGKQILTHAVTWTNAEDSMLSEKPITKDKYYMIPLTGGPWRSQIHRHKVER